MGYTRYTPGMLQSMMTFQFTDVGRLRSASNGPRRGPGAATGRVAAGHAAAAAAGAAETDWKRIADVVRNQLCIPAPPRPGWLDHVRPHWRCMFHLITTPWVVLVKDLLALDWGWRKDTSGAARAGGCCRPGRLMAFSSGRLEPQNFGFCS